MSASSVLVCAPAASTVSPCPSGYAPAVVDAYLVPAANAELYEAAFQPFDPSAASPFWAVAFVLPLALYFGTRIYAYFISVIR